MARSSVSASVNVVEVFALRTFVDLFPLLPKSLGWFPIPQEKNGRLSVCNWPDVMSFASQLKYLRLLQCIKCMTYDWNQSHALIHSTIRIYSHD